MANKSVIAAVNIKRCMGINYNQQNKRLTRQSLILIAKTFLTGPW